MLFGYRLPFTTPKLDVGERDRTRALDVRVRPRLRSRARSAARSPRSARVVLGSFSSDGRQHRASPPSLCTGWAWRWSSTGLTVTLAIANTAFLRVLRRGMVWFEQLAGILLILTGMYLCWYWYSSITDGNGGRVVAKATSWNDKLANFVQDHQTAVGVDRRDRDRRCGRHRVHGATQRAGVVTAPTPSPSCWPCPACRRSASCAAARSGSWRTTADPWRSRPMSSPARAAERSGASYYAVLQPEDLQVAHPVAQGQSRTRRRCCSRSSITSTP